MSKNEAKLSLASLKPEIVERQGLLSHNTKEECKRIFDEWVRLVSQENVIHECIVQSELAGWTDCILLKQPMTPSLTKSVLDEMLFSTKDEKSGLTLEKLILGQFAKHEFYVYSEEEGYRIKDYLVVLGWGRRCQCCLF